MKRSDQLLVESAVIAGVLIALTLGGSVVTTAVPPPFSSLQNPGDVKVNHDLGALAQWYNTTLTQIGGKRYANASFLLDTFRFVNIPQKVNATSQAANSDLANVNVTAPQAALLFQEARTAINAKEYVNATALISEGCALAGEANASLSDFQGAQTRALKSGSVPVGDYSAGSAAASALVDSLIAECNALRHQVSVAGQNSPALLIGSPQTVIETGGDVTLSGNLTLRGSPVPGQNVLFYINGTYFGTLVTDARGDLGGTLRIPFIYSQRAFVQALSLANSTAGVGGAGSNVLTFEILFNGTGIVIADPPAVLPTFGFNVEGNLSTVSGVPLPDAPVQVTFFSESQLLYTDSQGAFSTRLTVPANATDGTYNVYARFAPQGVFGPSVNFTSIQVIHLPLHLTVNAPSFTIAGFSMWVSGRASANGSGVAGAVVRVSSPWGSALATTDATGGYRVRVHVSAYEFAFTRDVVASAVSLPPYIAPADATGSVGLFNILLVTLPAAAVGVAGYEADKLGVFRRGKKHGSLTALEEDATLEVFSELESAKVEHELVRLYLRALRLASAKFRVGFRTSQTLREILAAVGSKDPGEGSGTFASLTMTLEDFLYTSTFDPERAGEARGLLAELEREWG